MGNRLSSTVATPEFRKASTAFVKAGERVLTLNNQNTLLLELERAISDDTVSFVLHDNRIFVFSIATRNITHGSSVSTPPKDVIQNVLTTTGMRILSFMFLFFRLFDDTAFLAIIVARIYHGGITIPTPDDYALFSVIGVEIFYDVLSTVNKYWILQRISLYIGIMLYIVYFCLLAYLHYHTQEIDSNRYHFVQSVLIFRLCCFIMEVCIDIFLDMCVHNTLLSNQNCQRFLNDPSLNTAVVSDAAIAEYCFTYRSHGESRDVNDMWSKYCSHLTTGNFSCHHCSATIAYTWYEKCCDPWTARAHHARSHHVNKWNYIDHAAAAAGVTHSNLSVDDYVRRTEVGKLIDYAKRANCMIPDRYTYLGSFLAWGPYSVHSWGDQDLQFDIQDFNQYFSSWVFLLILAPCLITGVIGVFVGLLSLMAALLMIVLMLIFAAMTYTFACCGWNANGGGMKKVCHIKHYFNFLSELKRF